MDKPEPVRAWPRWATSILSLVLPARPTDAASAAASQSHSQQDDSETTLVAQSSDSPSLRNTGAWKKRLGTRHRSNSADLLTPSSNLKPGDSTVPAISVLPATPENSHIVSPWASAPALTITPAPSPSLGPSPTSPTSPRPSAELWSESEETGTVRRRKVINKVPLDDIVPINEPFRSSTGVTDFMPPLIETPRGAFGRLPPLTHRGSIRGSGLARTFTGLSTRTKGTAKSVLAPATVTSPSVASVAHPPIRPTFETFERASNAALYFEQYYDALTRSDAKPRPAYRERRGRMYADDFDIGRVIGQGAFGVVRIAEEKRNGRLVAIKQLRKSDLLKMGQEGHIRAERDLLSAAAELKHSERSHHSWILQLFYSFQDQDFLYLVLDFMGGGDLLTLLMDRVSLPESMVKFYAAEMVLALQQTHALGYIHRDVKPDNFLFTSDGHIRIADFGLATDLHWAHDSAYYEQHRRVLLKRHGFELGKAAFGNRKRRTRDHAPAGSLAASQSGTGKDEGVKSILGLRRKQRRRLAYTICGTNSYMAPEVIRGEGYGFGVDWWSLGVILYEALYGCAPFLGSSRHDARVKILEWKDTLKFPRKPQISYFAVDFLRKLMCEPEDRLGSGPSGKRKVSRSRPGSASQAGSSTLSELDHQDGLPAGLTVPRPGCPLTPDGAEELMAHPWFFGIDWATIHTQSPPFKPFLDNPADTRHFDEDIPDEPLAPANSHLELRDPLLGDQLHGRRLLEIRKTLAFKGWTYSAPGTIPTPEPASTDLVLLSEIERPLTPRRTRKRSPTPMLDLAKLPPDVIASASAAYPPPTSVAPLADSAQVTSRPIERENSIGYNSAGLVGASISTGELNRFDDRHNVPTSASASTPSLVFFPPIADGSPAGRNSFRPLLSRPRSPPPPIASCSSPVQDDSAIVSSPSVHSPVQLPSSSESNHGKFDSIGRRDDLLRHLELDMDSTLTLEKPEALTSSTHTGSPSSLNNFGNTFPRPFKRTLDTRFDSTSSFASTAVTTATTMTSSTFNTDSPTSPSPRPVMSRPSANRSYDALAYHGTRGRSPYGYGSQAATVGNLGSYPSSGNGKGSHNALNTSTISVVSSPDVSSHSSMASTTSLIGSPTVHPNAAQKSHIPVWAATSGRSTSSATSSIRPLISQASQDSLYREPRPYSPHLNSPGLESRDRHFHRPGTPVGPYGGSGHPEPSMTVQRLHSESTTIEGSG